MIISLIGFMAAGKTTMARELSAKVGAPMIDTDACIEEREGRTISEIFAAVGEPGFRKIEEECLEDILEEHISEHPETLEDMHRCTLVLSLGGGIVTTPGCLPLYLLRLRQDRHRHHLQPSVEGYRRPHPPGEPGRHSPPRCHRTAVPRAGAAL